MKFLLNLYKFRGMQHAKHIKYGMKFERILNAAVGCYRETSRMSQLP